MIVYQNNLYGWRDLNSHESVSLEPKSNVSTNFTTSAYLKLSIIKINKKNNSLGSISYNNLLIIIN